MYSNIEADQISYVPMTYYGHMSNEYANLPLLEKNITQVQWGKERRLWSRQTTFLLLLLRQNLSI